MRHLCDRIGVAYGSETDFQQGAWFLDTYTRGRVNISQWSEGSHTGGRSVSRPLGSYGENLTHEQVYDRCWFADRVMTARSEAMTHKRATA